MARYTPNPLHQQRTIALVTLREIEGDKSERVLRTLEENVVTTSRHLANAELTKNAMLRSTHQETLTAILHLSGLAFGFTVQEYLGELQERTRHEVKRSAEAVLA